MYDQIVIGAGIIGSWTAHHLACNGNKVLLLEQFPLPHTRGSSTGQSRNFHSLAAYQPISEKAEEYYKALSKRNGGNLFLKVGRLQIGQKDGVNIKRQMEHLTKAGLNFEFLDGSREIGQKFPQFRFDDRYCATYEANAYTIMAAKVLKALHKEFVEAGGIIIDGKAVINVDSRPTWVRVDTTSDSYYAKGVAICVGPWAVEFLSKLQLHPRIHTQAVACTYWREKETGSHSYKNGFPCFSCRPEIHIYGIPSVEYPGLVKVAYHGGLPAEPDQRDNIPSLDVFIDSVKEFIREHMPGLESEPEIVEQCMYTWSEDQHFIVDFHPKHKNVVIGAGFCGNGFQISAGVGKMLADMLTGKEMTIKMDMKKFSIQRFDAHL